MEQWSSSPTVSPLHGCPKVKACNLIIIQILFNTGCLGVFYTSLRNLLQGLTTILVKKCFLMSSLSLHWHTLNSIHTSATGYWGKSSAPPFPFCLLKKLQRTMRSPLSLLFFQNREARSPYLLVMGHSFQHFSSLVAFLWTHSRTFTSFLNCGVQTCTHYSRWGWTNA